MSNNKQLQQKIASEFVRGEFKHIGEKFYTRWLNLQEKPDRGYLLQAWPEGKENMGLKALEYFTSLISLFNDALY